jgi:hypothetical protein
MKKKIIKIITKKGYIGRYPVKHVWEEIFPPGNYPKLLKHFNEIDFAILQALMQEEEAVGRSEIAKKLKEEWNLIKSLKWIGIRLQQLAKDKVLEEKKRGKYVLNPAVRNIFGDIIWSQTRLRLLETEPRYHYILSAVVGITHEEFTNPNLQQLIFRDFSTHGFQFFMPRGRERGKIISYSFYFQPIEELCTVFAGLTSGKTLDPPDTNISGITIDIHVNEAHSLYRIAKSFEKNLKISYNKILSKLAESVAWYMLLIVLRLIIDDIFISTGLRKRGIEIFEIYGSELHKKNLEIKTFKELLS